MDSLHPLRVVLISAPWSLFNRPSIQLGSLKAYLNDALPEVSVTAHHVYLQIAHTVGYDTYQAISERVWLAETVYAALLYPKRFDSIASVFRKHAKRNPVLAKTPFEPLTRKVARATRHYVRGTDWSRYHLAGFSVCVCQLTATLFLLKSIKQIHPKIITVVGGSTIIPDTTAGVLATFADIDAVVSGEGEIPLSRLVAHLHTDKPLKELPTGSGIVVRNQKTPEISPRFCQIDALEDLPVPDFSDYFNQLEALPASKQFFASLPVEMSRGCWWCTNEKQTGSVGCAFCNLNSQWYGYRSKSAQRMVAEIDSLTRRHRLLSVAFMDNLLPLGSSADLFNGLTALGKDFRLFGEIRAVTPKTVLEKMQKAGMTEVQIGIEALSSRLLRKLNKGTSAIINLEIMKNCEELGIRNTANLICNFPGSDSRDVAETLHTLSFAWPYRPLKVVNFWLGVGSPVYQHYKTYGIHAVYNHPDYAKLFPVEVLRLKFIHQAYRGDLGYQRKIWKPVQAKVKQWQATYARLKQRSPQRPLLGFQDGRDFMILRQVRDEGAPLTHRLEGTSRQIYLFCRRNRSFVRICSEFPNLDSQRIKAFLTMMGDKGLMFEEKERYLSLAVAERIDKPIQAD